MTRESVYPDALANVKGRSFAAEIDFRAKPGAPAESVDSVVNDDLVAVDIKDSLVDSVVRDNMVDSVAKGSLVVADAAGARRREPKC